MSKKFDTHAGEAIPEAALAELHEILKTGDLFRYTAGKDSPVAKLEEEFANWIGAKYALAVNSCSSALFLSLRALDLKPGARVLVPAFTFAAVPSAIVHANCIPVLIDVADNYRIDLEDFHNKFDNSIDAVMISHMRGHTSDMDAIVAACEAKSVPLIEDAAHSLGTVWDGKKIGTIGKMGCFSFQSYKLLNAGEGGILVTDDEDLIARAAIMSGAYEHNWKKHRAVGDKFAKWQNRLPLYNCRMSNLSAAVLRPQIGEIETRATRGLKNYQYISEKLNACDHFTVPPALSKEVRAPDSIQFNLVNFTDQDVEAFIKDTADQGLKVQVFGAGEDNARVFWNWRFIPPQGDLSMTRNMLMRACDVRLTTQIQLPNLHSIAETLIASAVKVKEGTRNVA